MTTLWVIRGVHQYRRSFRDGSTSRFPSASCPRGHRNVDAHCTGERRSRSRFRTGLPISTLNASIVTRPLQEDVAVGLGIAWKTTDTSPLLSSFIDLAREATKNLETPLVKLTNFLWS